MKDEPAGTAMMKDRVLGRIKSGQVAMHSQFYFAMRIAALVVVLLLALVVSILLFTFLFFTIRINIHDAMSPLGADWWLMFARFFPWHLLILDILLVAAAEWLMRSFLFAYRSPAVYLLFVLLAFVLALAAFIDHAGFNDQMLQRARAHRLPEPFSDMYDRAPRPELIIVR